MAVTIIIKRSGTTGHVPTSGQLQVGELAVNYVDGRIWTKHNDGTVKELTGKGVIGAPTAGPPGPPGAIGPPGNSLPGPIGPIGPTTTVNIT